MSRGNHPSTEGRGGSPERPAAAVSEALASLFPSHLRRHLVDLRRELHRHPELSWKEERTGRRLFDELRALKPVTLERVAGTGVVARIAGRNPDAPPVAIRGDIDALPIQEETGLTYASEVPGVMHACGHDVHAAWTVGAARLLTREPAAGDVVIVLQPAEEVAEGATAMLNAGVLDGVGAIFGGHVDTRFEVGRVVAQAGPIAASTDFFEVELVGSSSHGARPEEGTDPIAGAAALVDTVYSVVPRRLGSTSPAVLSFGILRAGTAINVIPGRAEMAGTFRTVDPRIRELLAGEIERLAKATAATYRLDARVSLRPGVPPVLNARETASWARRAVVELLGERAIVPLGTPNMAGEDFALYTERVPGCFLRVGAREPRTVVTPAHSPHFRADEGAIFVGAAVLADTARIASAALAE